MNHAAETARNKALPMPFISRQVARRELRKKHFPAYPGFMQGRVVGNVSAHSKFGRFLPRDERKRLARAFAAGEWNKIVAGKSSVAEVAAA